MAVGTESQKTPVALPAARDQAGFFLSDRATPSHLRAVSIAFCVFSVAAILATILSTSILFELLALQAQSHLFPVLLLGASIPVLAYFILDWFHARALGGFRFARVAHQTLVFAVFGSVFSVALCLVHPALGVASLIAAVLSFLTLRLFIWLDWRESVWDFTAEEATSILAGRDTVGRNLADSWKQTHSIVDSVFAALLIMNFVATSAVASWLSGRDVLDPAGVLPLAVLAPWATFGIQRWLRLHFQPTDKQSATLKSTLDFERPNGDADDVWAKGLVVQDLRASDAAGDLLLHNISFHLPPGRVIGLRGDHGSGKSLLLQTLASPLELSGFEISGSVTVGGRPTWQRTVERSDCEMVHLPVAPILLEGSGAQNIACFRRGDAPERALALLEKFVYSLQTAKEIVAVKDARKLPGGYKAVLALARAFAIAPKVFLLDKPETSLSPKMLNALGDLIKSEVHKGRSFVICTTERSLLDLCDDLLVLEAGRVLEFDEADAVRKRLQSGWSRFVGQRSITADDNLESWIRSHFKRNGDEENRRNACEVASELLALNCLGGDFSENETLTFDFKHFAGHCLLKVTANEKLITSTQFALAEKELKQGTTSRLSPLARLLSLSETFTCTGENELRTIEVKVATYDPRKMDYEGRNITSMEQLRAMQNSVEATEVR